MADMLNNMLLERLSPSVSSALSERLFPVRLERKQPLFEEWHPMREVYFPASAVCSLISVMRDGKTAEIATIGREGMVGAAIMFGARSLPFRGICQVAGDAYAMPSTGFSQLLADHAELRSYIERFVRAYFVQIGQNSACNSVHDVMRRTARWLLLTHDRAGGGDFDMTQDLLAEMLGVRRATVTEAASELQRRGLIGYRRGRVHIADRSGLEHAACECYDVIRRAYREIDDDPGAK